MTVWVISRHQREKAVSPGASQKGLDWGSGDPRGWAAWNEGWGLLPVDTRTRQGTCDGPGREGC